MSDRWKALGPGLLMAGAAIGVSHLVQSTRAGAVYGFGLAGLIVLANLAKYPAFRFGPQHAAATGTSLLEGYRRQGRWALGLYFAVTLGTMFAVQAAVAVVCAGLAKALFGLDASAPAIAAVIIALCALLLAVGRYRWLDAINKVILVVLTLATLAATVIALPRIDFAAMSWWPAGPIGEADVFFFAALVGWMPSAVDITVWNSLWTLARRESTGHTPTPREALFDFHVGYWGTAILALCFMVLGAAVMHGTGAVIPESAGGFAAQVIALYTASLGEWSRPLIGVSAFLVMFSTTFAVVDGFPRALAVLWLRLRAPERPWSAEESAPGFKPAYWVSIVTLATGAIAVLFLLMSSLTAMVDLATTLSFLTAPALAWLNHRAMTSDAVPAAHRPAPWLRLASLGGIAFLTAFALYYTWLRFLTD
ncbi:MAG: divalent metal cation transporter [Myxococcales bacterium]|nr:divalent metal cation transporter [Myxococcales bacterium]